MTSELRKKLMALKLMRKAAHVLDRELLRVAGESPQMGFLLEKTLNCLSRYACKAKYLLVQQCILDAYNLFTEIPLLLVGFLSSNLYKHHQ